MTTQSIASYVGSLMPFRKKKYRYLQSRESFYESRNYLASPGRLSSFIDRTSTNDLEAKKPIRFYGLEFGTSMKVTLDHLGKPNYMSKKSALLKKHVTIYYRITIAQVKCILQLHFLQDQFFLGLIEIRNATQEMKQEVMRLIKRKYNVDDDQWRGSICDADNHQIELKDDIVPYIVYKSGHEKINESIAVQLASITKVRQRYYEKRSDLFLEMI